MPPRSRGCPTTRCSTRYTAIKCFGIHSAKNDLDAVQTLVRRCSLRLFETDLALGQSRCIVAADDRAAARTTLEHARKRITEMSFSRRIPELNALGAKSMSAT